MLTMAILFISNPPATSAFNMERTCAPQVNIRPPILWLFMRAVWRTERTEDRWLHVRGSACDAATSGGSRSNDPQRDASSGQRLKYDTLRHLSRDLLVLQNLIECPANDVVAFARRCFQPPAVDDLDSPASIFYEVLRLQRLGDQCYDRSATSPH